jgi:hypothetical protein
MTTLQSAVSNEDPTMKTRHTNQFAATMMMIQQSTISNDDSDGTTIIKRQRRRRSTHNWQRFSGSDVNDTTINYQ